MIYWYWMLHWYYQLYYLQTPEMDYWKGGNEKNLGSGGNCSDSNGGDSTFIVGVIDPDIGAVVDIFRTTGRCFFSLLVPDCYFCWLA